MRRRLFGMAVLAALLMTALVVGAQTATLARASTAFAFSNYQLGTIANESCPNASQPCTNIAAEPQIRADKAGTFYASSENGLGGGTDAWKSTDGGNHFTVLPSPNSVSSTNNTGFAPGGGDTDLATAPVKNSAGS